MYFQCIVVYLVYTSKRDKEQIIINQLTKQVLVYCFGYGTQVFRRNFNKK